MSSSTISCTWWIHELDSLLKIYIMYNPINFISLTMNQSELKHVGENIVYTNRMCIYRLRSVFWRDLIKSEAICMEDAKY